MHPLGPLGIEPAVGFLVLGLEHPDDFAVTVFDKVTAAAALIDTLRKHSALDGMLGLTDQISELRIIYERE